MDMNRSRSAFAIVLASVLLGGCMSWSPGWEVSAFPPSDEETSTLLESADRLFESASDGDQLRRAIDTYERVLASNPGNRRALDRLAEANILYGAAYSKGKKEKAASYRAGITWAESSMATNTAFRRRVESGATVGEAANELNRDELKAMLLWVTGVSYYFKECLSVPGKLVHFRWMTRTREVMERMLAIDQDFENGAVLFSLGIYHIASPPGAGRDLDLSAQYLDKAIASGPASLLVRWGRAKYFYSRTEDRDGFRSDLEWVVAQDPRAATSPFPWNVYFQRDARQMLIQAAE